MIDFLEAFAKVCLMVGGICVVAILLGWPAAHWIGGKVATFLTFLPTEKFLKPQPALGIPATLAMRGDLHGAVAAYEELLLVHPHEHEIYFRLLEIVLGPLALAEYGDDVLCRGVANLPGESEKAALVRLAHELRDGSYKPFKHLEVASPQRAERLPDLCRPVSGSSLDHA